MTVPYIEICETTDRDAWLEARMDGLGASNAATLVEESRREGRVELWARLTGRIGGKEQTEAMKRGHRLEPVAAAIYSLAERSGRACGRQRGKVRVRDYDDQLVHFIRVPQLMLRSVDHRWAQATIDGWTEHPDHGLIPLEIKTTEIWNRDAWSNGPPLETWWQTQQQMLVTGAPAVSVACLIGMGDLVWCDIERDPIAQRSLAHWGPIMWQCVDHGRPPQHRPSSAAARILYPPDKVRDNEIKLEGLRWLDLSRELDELKGELGKMLDRKDQLEGQIREAIGTATRVTLADGSGWTYKVSSRGGKQVRTLRRVGAK